MSDFPRPALRALEGGRRSPRGMTRSRIWGCRAQTEKRNSLGSILTPLVIAVAAAITAALVFTFPQWSDFASFGFSTIAAESGKPLIGVASVIDGDTIEIHGERIRFLDMDAPETRQLCQDASGTAYRCGQKAALALSDFIGQRTVTCDWSERDRYGRILGRCTVAGQDAGLWLVSQGWAVPYRDCKCEVYRDAARSAERSKIGIWSGSFELPWDWRKAH